MKSVVVLQAPGARLFSKVYKRMLDGKSIVVVVMTDTDVRRRHWIVTAYLTRKLVAGETEWKRD